MGRSILQRIGSVIVVRFGELVIGMIITPILVRLLGSAQYGEYATILSIIAICMIFVNAGIFDGLRKYIAEKRDSQWATYVFSFYFRLGMTLAVLASLIILTAIRLGFISDVFSETFIRYLYFLPVILLVEQLFNIIRGTLLGFGRETQAEPLWLIRTIAYGGIGLLLVYHGYGIPGILIGQILALGLAALIGFVLILNDIDVRGLVRQLPESFPKKELSYYNYLSIVLSLFVVSLFNIDIIMLQAFVGSNQTGYYKAALVVAEFLWFAPLAIQAVFLQTTSEMWMKKQYEAIQSLVSRTTRYTLLLTLLIGIGIAALAEPFVFVYFGPEFGPAVIPLLILLPGSAGFAVALPILSAGQGKGDFRPFILVTGAASAINLILNYSLIPIYGMRGAAAATTIGYGIMFPLQALAIKKLGLNPLEDLRLSQVLATAVFSTPIIFGLSVYINSNIVSLFIVPILGFVIYSIFAFLFGAIDTEDLYRIYKPF